MKKLTMTLAALALAATAANAEPILNGYTGPLQFKYQNYETLISAQGQTLSGIFKVTSIVDNNANTLWFDTKGGAEITGVFGNLLASSVVPPTSSNPFFTVDFTGGNLSMYYDTTPDFNPNGGAGGASGFADGMLVLSANFVPGITSSTSTTFHSVVDGLTTVTTGKGSAYGEVTGGALGAILNSNSEFNGADLLFESDLSRSGNGWPVTSHDPVSALAVPETGTIALLGLGMMSLIGLKRCRVKN
jgi:hypothetical protein